MAGQEQDAVMFQLNETFFRQFLKATAHWPIVISVRLGPWYAHWEQGGGKADRLMGVLQPVQFVTFPHPAQEIRTGLEMAGLGDPIGMPRPWLRN